MEVNPLLALGEKTSQGVTECSRQPPDNCRRTELCLSMTRKGTDARSPPSWKSRAPAVAAAVAAAIAAAAARAHVYATAEITWADRAVVDTMARTGTLRPG